MSLTPVILIVFHLFMIGLRIGKNWDEFHKLGFDEFNELGVRLCCIGVETCYRT